MSVDIINKQVSNAWPCVAADGNAYLIGPAQQQHAAASRRSRFCSWKTNGRNVRDRPRGTGMRSLNQLPEMLPMLSLIPSGRHCDCPRRVFLVWTAFA